MLCVFVLDSACSLTLGIPTAHYLIQITMGGLLIAAAAALERQHSGLLSALPKWVPFGAYATQRIHDRERSVPGRLWRLHRPDPMCFCRPATATAAGPTG